MVVKNSFAAIARKTNFYFERLRQCGVFEAFVALGGFSFRYLVLIDLDHGFAFDVDVSAVHSFAVE